MRAVGKQQEMRLQVAAAASGNHKRSYGPV